MLLSSFGSIETFISPVATTQVCSRYSSDLLQIPYVYTLLLKHFDFLKKNPMYSNVA